MLEDETTINFLAKDRETASYWIDGFSLLLGKKAINLRASCADRKLGTFSILYRKILWFIISATFVRH